MLSDQHESVNNPQLHNHLFSPSRRASQSSITTQFNPVTLSMQAASTSYPTHAVPTCHVAHTAQLSEQSINSRRSVTLGRPIPKWMLSVMQYLLGINPDNNKRRIFGKLLCALTVVLALGYLFLSLRFIHVDIVSRYTKTTVVDGTVTILFLLLWCVLGNYANGLAYRLYSNEQFRPLMRMPTKSIFGMNAAVLLLILLVLAMAVNNYAGLWLLESSACEGMLLECQLMYVFRVSFSLLAFTWHYMVMFMLVAVSRSFTISIRQLMRTLEEDGRAYECNYLGVAHAPCGSALLQEYAWIDEDFCASMREGEAQQQQQHVEDEQDMKSMEERYGTISRSSSCANLVSRDEPTPVGAFNCAYRTMSLPPSPLPDHYIASRPSTPPPVYSNQYCSSPTAATTITATPNPTSASSHLKPPSPSCPTRSSSDPSLQCAQPYTAPAQRRPSRCRTCRPEGTARPPPPLLSNAELLYQIWKIQTGLRIFGVATQRWMLSVVCLVITWLAINLVVWLNVSPTLLDLVNQCLPLLLLPLLSATYAEVNFEGDRLPKFVAPTEERLGVLYLMQASPLQLTIYGFSLSYATITTAGFGLLVALASKVFLQEINKEAV